MSNTSKVLLIAGSILVAILLITGGIMEIKGKKPNSPTASTDILEKETFNNQYIVYLGKQKASSVKNLIGKVNENNSNRNENGHIIQIVYTASKPSDFPELCDSLTPDLPYGAGETLGDTAKEARQISEFASKLTDKYNYTIQFDYAESIITKAYIEVTN